MRITLVRYLNIYDDGWESIHKSIEEANQAADSYLKSTKVFRLTMITFEQRVQYWR
jgi:hypothetical protein